MELLLGEYDNYNSPFLKYLSPTIIISLSNIYYFFFSKHNFMSRLHYIPLLLQTILCSLQFLPQANAIWPQDFETITNNVYVETSNSTAVPYQTLQIVDDSQIEIRFDYNGLCNLSCVSEGGYLGCSGEEKSGEVLC